MQNITSEKLLGSINKWWYYLILGLLFLSTGLWILFYAPQRELVGLDRWLAMLILLTGIFEMVMAAYRKDAESRWWWKMIIGGLEAIFGVIMLLVPGASLRLLMFFLGGWMLLRGAFLITFSFRLMRVGDQPWLRVLIGGIVVVLLAFFVFSNPWAESVTPYFWVAVSLLASGLFHILLSFDLLGLKKEINRMEKQGLA